MKKPKGWRPGKTPKFKPHPSIIRHRDPDVRSWINLGLLDGATHVRFVCNPECCAICEQLDGRVQRAATVSAWIYTLPHPNCLCHWEPGKMVRGEFTDDLAAKGEVMTEPLDEISEFAFQHSDPRSNPRLLIKASSGLVQKEVTVRRNGQTFKQKRWVKDGVGAATEKKERKEKKVDSKEKEKSVKNVKIPEAVKKSLSSIQGQVGKIPEGATKKVKGHNVTALQGGFYGVEVLGRRVVAAGAHAAAIIVDYGARAGISAGSLAAGDVSEKGAAGASATAASVTGKAKATAQKVSAKAEEKKREQDAEEKEKGASDGGKR